MAALAGAALASIAVGYLLATTYLVLRDDILNAAIARQARMQYAYEDRIAALRSQVDRITSYRLLDQQIMESKVAELLTRQSVLAQRSDRLAPLLDKAQSRGVDVLPEELDPSRIPVPAATGEPDPAGRTLFRSQTPIRGGLKEARATINDESSDIGAPLLALSRLGTALNHLESDQLDQVAALADSARKMRQEMIRDARNVGLEIDIQDSGETGIGGPFIPADGNDAVQSFDEELDNLNRELQALDEARSTIRSFPITNPVPGRSITSGFGNRRDPLIGRNAFHAGIDLSAPTGTPILAGGDGTVIMARRNGGYGKMVEIRHANGLITRYAHMSRIAVKEGEAVAAGSKVGEAGSTGRSTGPHLHYEIRHHEKAVNPMLYLKAGTRLGRYL